MLTLDQLKIGKSSQKFILRNLYKLVVDFLGGRFVEKFSVNLE